MKKSICEMDENSKNKRLHYNLFRYKTNKHKSNKRINMSHVLSHVFLEYKLLFPFMKTNWRVSATFNKTISKKCANKTSRLSSKVSWKQINIFTNHVKDYSNISNSLLSFSFTLLKNTVLCCKCGVVEKKPCSRLSLYQFYRFRVMAIANNIGWWS